MMKETATNVTVENLIDHLNDQLKLNKFEATSNLVCLNRTIQDVLYSCCCNIHKTKYFVDVNGERRKIKEYANKRDILILDDLIYIKKWIFDIAIKEYKCKSIFFNYKSWYVCPYFDDLYYNCDPNWDPLFIGPPKSKMHQSNDVPVATSSMYALFGTSTYSGWYTTPDGGRHNIIFDNARSPFPF